ncbi:MAG: hypothetical protein FJ350_02045 [Sphingomonadales bacterium]|nr:hypothetical protein [Sphingomonadales bacterium]MBM3923261.1 hypothetical protein [Sphingomonadales bacterium]
MDLRLLREWIRNPLLLEGVDGQDLEHLLREAPAFEAGQILYLQRMKINHSSRFSKALASYSAMTDQGQWLYRAIERQQSTPEVGAEFHISSLETSPEVPNEVKETKLTMEQGNAQQTRLDWFTLLGQVDWKAMESDELDLLYAEYTQTDYLEASADLSNWSEGQTADCKEPTPSNKVPEESRNEMDRIREMAAKSLDLEEVPVSESLAGLYLEQGQRAMAVRVYRRLMLRFPSKLGYFRDCIDQIESNSPR